MDLATLLVRRIRKIPRPRRRTPIRSRHLRHLRIRSARLNDAGDNRVWRESKKQRCSVPIRSSNTRGKGAEVAVAMAAAVEAEAVDATEMTMMTGRTSPF